MTRGLCACARTRAHTNPPQIFSQALIRIKAYQSRLQGGAKQNDGPGHKMAAAGRRRRLQVRLLYRKKSTPQNPPADYSFIFSTVGGESDARAAWLWRGMRAAWTPDVQGSRRKTEQRSGGPGGVEVGGGQGRGSPLHLPSAAIIQRRIKIIQAALLYLAAANSIRSAPPAGFYSLKVVSRRGGGTEMPPPPRPSHRAECV